VIELKRMHAKGEAKWEIGYEQQRALQEAVQF
jgi:hypothetical protein